MLQTTTDLESLQAEHARLHTLSKLFDCSELLSKTAASIKSTDEQLLALKATWQKAGMAEQKLAEWNKMVRLQLIRMVRLGSPPMRTYTSAGSFPT